MEECELRAVLCLETDPERAAGLPAWEAGEGQISPPGTFKNKDKNKYLMDYFTIKAVKIK